MTDLFLAKPIMFIIVVLLYGLPVFYGSRVSIKKKQGQGGSS